MTLTFLKPTPLPFRFYEYWNTSLTQTDLRVHFSPIFLKNKASYGKSLELGFSKRTFSLAGAVMVDKISLRVSLVYVLGSEAENGKWAMQKMNQKFPYIQDSEPFFNFTFKGSEVK